MRILYINDTRVDIDEQTAIGITYQSFDIKEPDKPRISISNTFTIPKTANNLAIFGNPHDPQSTTTTIYDACTVNYYVNNTQFLHYARAQVSQITDRIELTVFEKPTIWDTLSTYTWNTLQVDLLDWLQTEKGYPSFLAPSADTFSTIIDNLATNTEGLILPYYHSGIDTLGFADVNICDNALWYKGGHICVYLKTIFEFLEYKFGTSFGATVTETGNAFNDAVISSVYIPMRDVIMENAGSGWYFQTIAYTWQIPYLPYRHYPHSVSVLDKENKTATDLIKAFVGHFNLIKNESFTDGVHSIRFYRFEQLATSATVLDWSGKISKLSSFKPSVDGYAQNSYIKFGSIFDGGDAYINARNIQVLNQNLDVNSDIITLDAHVPALYSTADVSFDLSTEKSYETFIFFVSNGTVTKSVGVLSPNTLYAGVTLQLAQLYELSNEYTLFQSVMQRPKLYTAELWLNPILIENFNFFSLIYIRELNGSFFLNKIENYNPDKSRQAASLELLYVSDKTPQIITGNFWVDGIGDIWTDGTGDFFN